MTLFTSLFRGRPDVFATRWESMQAPNRSGWAPKCSNEWEPGLCFKPKVKCAACSQRRFVPFSPAEAAAPGGSPNGRDLPVAHG
ncbi:MAG: TOTE conflict system archaeo-eukaryotic primase domain-containing protein [Solirubrobacteraceae bacterium]